MPVREQDDLPYRSPVTAASAPASTSSVNEENYNTLKIVRALLEESMAGLYKDFNAFSILSQEDTDKAAANLLRQIEAKQIAFDILSPVLDAVDNAVQAVDSKYKQR